MGKNNMKCPKCGGETDYRDVHPDGIMSANLECLTCDWYEKKVESTEDVNLEDLPF